MTEARDRPVITDVVEIAVTGEMVDAGLDELREHHYAGDVREMLEAVYLAMAYASASASVTSRSR